MKRLTGRKVYKKEGRDRERLHSEIECSECGAKTYERRSTRIKAALEKDCKNCEKISAAEHQLKKKQSS